MPQTYLDQGLEARWFQEADIPADLDAITLAEWADGVDVSDQLIVDASTFEETAPDTNDERVYSTKGKSIEPTLRNVNANGVFRRERDGSGIPNGSDPLQYFDDRQVGVMAIRTGIGVDASAAAGQEYNYFRLKAGYTQIQNKPTSGKDNLTVGFLQNGDPGVGYLAA